MDHVARIDELEESLRAHRDRFDPPADPPDEEQADTLLRDGFGPAVWVYVEGRTGGRMVQFTPEQHERLERTMNGWLELYARCYGREIDTEFTVRKAAELLIETRNVHDTAQLLTDVPAREYRD